MTATCMYNAVCSILAVHMQSKTLRFTEEDQKKFELIKNELSEATGIDSDIGVIRYLVSQHLYKKKPAKEEVEVIKKKKPIPKEVKEDYDSYMVNPSKQFCINHPDRFQDKCECFTNGNMIKGFMRFHGYGYNCEEEYDI
jgi:hypothetical protein